jgi:hypothetical protein
MNHSQFLAKLNALKFILLNHDEGYDSVNKANCSFTFAGEPKEGIILQCESLEFGPRKYNAVDHNKSLLTRVEAFFSVLLTKEEHNKVKEALEKIPLAEIQLETPVGDKIAANVRVSMGIGTPDDVFNTIDYFRKVGVLQAKWTSNPPMLFSPTYVIDNTIGAYKLDPENLQRYLVQTSQRYIDQARAGNVYPFAKIVHPQIGNHAGGA